MVRGIDVGGVVRTEPSELLDRPSFAVTEQLRADSEELADRIRTSRVVGELDLGAQQIRRLRRTRDNRY